MAVKFVMQEWVDKYYEETGEAGCWNGNLYTGQYLRWCLQHLTDELEKTAPQKINVAQNSASDNTTKVQICPECEGLGYTEPTLQDPDGLCPKCRGAGKL